MWNVTCKKDLFQVMCHIPETDFTRCSLPRSQKIWLQAYVPVKSKLQHPPPPLATPGHLNFWKISVQIPPSPSQIAVQMPPPRENKPFYIIWRSKLFSSIVKYISEDAASVCTWYLKFYRHIDEFRMPETPSADIRHDLSCLVQALRHVT